MTRRLSTIVLLAGVALLASATQARCEEKKDQQDASNSAQSTTDDQQKSSTDNSNASSNTSNNTTNSNTSDKNQSKESASNPALPAPANSNSDANRAQDKSASRANDDSRDNDKSNRNEAGTQGRSNDTKDNQARSDQRDSRSNDRDRNSQDFKAGIQIGRASGRGITVNTVRRGTIFYDSGLRDGDVIVSYNRRPIRSRDDFDRFVVYQRGERVPIVVLRDGREKTIYITYRDEATRERSYISSDHNRGAYFGAEFDPQITDAVIVIRVDQGSPADRAGLRRDDVVLSLNGKKVTSGKEANNMIASMNSGDRVEIEYSRHARTEAVLSGDREREVATRTSEDRVETSRDTSVETRDSDSQRYNSSRDSNYRDRSSNDRSQGRGIFGRRR
jgi:C-terminal processing protease CtpA/Prc